MNPSPANSRAHRQAAHPALLKFRPHGTVRCSDDLPAFRNQLARDLGCLLDVDEAVAAWCCRPSGMDRVLLDTGWKGSRPDFLVTYADGQQFYLHATEGPGDPEVTEAAACRGMRHRFVEAADIRAGPRLQNAQDLLRYAHVRAPLGDRMRILAALEQEGFASVADCMGLFREANPMAGLASLILNRFVAIDLDVELIAPHTEVRLFRN
ncbi:hypothetical protein [Sinorhizobium terangae]|uniref:hypothetical protein n=1 Tax=Sinorhizobium terangae TaxID=110322 RepID=UPI0024B10509|nr:hypothetical protein [Sinorhizobium terangae]WFU49156.1 hypothetical protein QA637_07090 [Sinorhizobium terangae]